MLNLVFFEIEYWITYKRTILLLVLSIYIEPHNVDCIQYHDKYEQSTKEKNKSWIEHYYDMISTLFAHLYVLITQELSQQCKPR